MPGQSVKAGLPEHLQKLPLCPHVYRLSYQLSTTIVNKALRNPFDLE